MDDDEFVFPLMLGMDISSLTMSLVSIGSPTGHEGAIADSVEAALRVLPHLSVERLGNTVIARTDEGHDERVIVAGHLSTALGDPEDDPVAFVEMGKLSGPGTADVKGGLAVALKAAALSASARARDVTFVFYDGRGDAAAPGGLDRLAETHPDVLVADFAVVLEPRKAGAAGTADALEHPLGRRLVELTELPAGAPAAAPDGNDLAVFARLDVPALAFGPGDPAVAGTPGEFVRTAELSQCEYVLREWLK